LVHIAVGCILVHIAVGCILVSTSLSREALVTWFSNVSVSRKWKDPRLGLVTD